MKKILLILIMFFITGCYDYVEINDLSFVSAIGIDYEEDVFKLTYEILNDTKKSSDGSSQDGYTITGSGKTIATAFDNISLKSTKLPYFYHLKAVVISEEVAKNHTKEIVEFITRNPEIRNEFHFTIAKDVKASEIIKNSSENNPIVGNQITKLIESNVNYYNATFAKPFEDLLEKFLNKKNDPIANVLTLSGTELKTVGIGLFSKYKYIDVLNDKDSAYLNALLNMPLNMVITKEYDNKLLAVNLYDGNVSYEFEGNNIYVTFDCEGEIVENLPEFDLRREETYLKISKDFSKKVSDDIDRLINYLVSENIDAVGFENMYYKKYRKENPKILKDMNIIVNANVTVNKKGLIFEVEYE